MEATESEGTAQRVMDVRYRGPADLLEWPADSGQMYARGAVMPLSEADVTHLSRFGHRFETGAEGERDVVAEPAPAADEPPAAPEPESEQSKLQTEATAIAADPKEQTGSPDVEASSPADATDVPSDAAESPAEATASEPA